VVKKLVQINAKKLRPDVNNKKQQIGGMRSKRVESNNRP